MYNFYRLLFILFISKWTCKFTHQNFNFLDFFIYGSFYISKCSPLDVFLGKSVLKIISNLTGEHPCWSVISIKLLCKAWIWMTYFDYITFSVLQERELFSQDNILGDLHLFLIWSLRNCYQISALVLWKFKQINFDPPWNYQKILWKLGIIYKPDPDPDPDPDPQKTGP